MQLCAMSFSVYYPGAAAMSVIEMQSCVILRDWREAMQRNNGFEEKGDWVYGT